MSQLSADELFRRAAECQRAGRAGEAAELCRRVVEMEPKGARGWNLLGILAGQAGRVEEAVECVERAVRLEPGKAGYWQNLGQAFWKKKDYAGAEGAYRKALEIEPKWAAVWVALGSALFSQEKLEEAVRAFGEAVRLEPGSADFQNKLGNALGGRGRWEEAARAYERAIALRGDFTGARSNLANVWRELGKTEEAMGVFREIIAKEPEFADAYYHLADALKEAGQVEEALAVYREGMARWPGDARMHSNYVYLLPFSAEVDGRGILEETRKWGERHAAGVAGKPFLHERGEGRRLRVGYVSPDFYRHAVGMFLWPLLRDHDHEKFEIFCYASLRKSDDLTEKLKGCADVWRDVRGLNDEQLAETIRQDKVDILVDLTMHMANHRLMVFARKPAPVQVTYLAYCGTTGVEAMDYRVSDPYLDPPGEEEFYVEKTVRMGRSYWCYPKRLDGPEVTGLPAKEKGGGEVVTFGCLNNFCKVNRRVLESWREILGRVAGSRLILHAKEGGHRERVLRFMEEGGIGRGRVEFVGMLGWEDYLRVYQGIDIGLDPFPCGGGTTTCDALWMGVPVVSLAGRTAVGRGGLSILSNLGLGEWVARTREEYAEKAAEMARDLGRLEELRRGMRERMLKSALMDGAGMAREMESLYREMWGRWGGEVKSSDGRS